MIGIEIPVREICKRLSAFDSRLRQPATEAALEAFMLHHERAAPFADQFFIKLQEACDIFRPNASRKKAAIRHILDLRIFSAAFLSGKLSDRFSEAFERSNISPESIDDKFRRLRAAKFPVASAA